jgi:hypothetical protein
MWTCGSNPARTSAAAAARSAAPAAYSWIPDFFVSHVGPEPAGLDGSIAVMEEAERLLYDHEGGWCGWSRL